MNLRKFQHINGSIRLRTRQAKTIKEQVFFLILWIFLTQRIRKILNVYKTLERNNLKYFNKKLIKIGEIADETFKQVLWIAQDGGWSLRNVN